MADHDGNRTGGHPDCRSGCCDDDAIHVVDPYPEAEYASSAGEETRISSRRLCPAAPRASESRDLTSIVYNCVHRVLLVRSRPFKAVEKLQLCARRARDSTHGKHKERQSPILR